MTSIAEYVDVTNPGRDSSNFVPSFGLETNKATAGRHYNYIEEILVNVVLQY